VAIETAIQNGGIAVVVLNLTFPRSVFQSFKLIFFRIMIFSPYSDMALLPILAFFFCSAGPFLFTLFAIRRVFDKIMGREEDSKTRASLGKMSFDKIRSEEETEI
jgi:hypothetical protein